MKRLLLLELLVIASLNMTGLAESTEQFRSLGKTLYPHASIQGIKLKNGDVLIYSFDSPNLEVQSPGLKTNSPAFSRKFEIYRAKAKQFETVASPHYKKGAEAVLLQNGEVLFTGSLYGCSPLENSRAYQDICEKSSFSEIYDPASNTYRLGPPLNFPRQQSGMTLLQDGRVLIVGGFAAFPPAKKQVKTTISSLPSLDRVEEVSLSLMHQPRLRPNQTAQAKKNAEISK